jgi:hypothetical protein
MVCPRCSGRLVHASDWLSTYATCLMCGYTHESQRVDASLARLEVEAEADGRTLRVNAASDRAASASPW